MLRYQATTTKTSQCSSQHIHQSQNLISSLPFNRASALKNTKNHVAAFSYSTITKENVNLEQNQLIWNNQVIPIVYGDISEIMSTKKKKKNNFIIINKPSGLTVEGALNNPESCLEDIIQKQLGTRPYFPHRIDRMTSGILVIAFSPHMSAKLSSSLQKAKKRYRVLTDIPPCVARSIKMRRIAKPRTIDRDRCVFAQPYLHWESHVHRHQDLQDAQSQPEERMGKVREGKLEHPLVRVTPGGMPRLIQNGEIHSFIAKRNANQRKKHQFSREWQRFKRHFPELVQSYTNRPQCQNIQDHESPCPCCPATHHMINGRTPRHPFLADFLLSESVPSRGVYQGRSSTTSFSLARAIWRYDCALYEVSLPTGRSHQIRVHFADAGFPVMNDVAYNLPFAYSIQERCQYMQSHDDHYNNNNNNGENNKKITPVKFYNRLFTQEGRGGLHRYLEQRV
eukprot:gb/GECH01010545.1/.p1 GENE.gb/GECH01010545.1/~~gb/GECH01010545.1/.p1  ORF type:complete len:452 (+),score=98.06 gb/GECH01010545.1/:1-1356(+)